MIEAAHLTRQETKELCQQEVQRYIHVPLCTILKTYLFFIIVQSFRVFRVTPIFGSHRGFPYTVPVKRYRKTKYIAVTSIKVCYMHSHSYKGKY